MSVSWYRRSGDGRVITVSRSEELVRMAQYRLARAYPNAAPMSAAPQPLRTGELERLPDGRQPEGFASMDRDVEVFATDVLEGVEIPGRRVPLLGARDVEADDPRIAPADGAFGDLDRAGGLAHRG